MAPPSESPPPSTCPVDPAARAAWLEAASTQHASPHPLPQSTTSKPTSSQPPPPRIIKQRPLAADRVISSIPRADSSPSTITPNPTSPPTPTSSPNAQTNTPLTSPSGNWIYPSERMFFDALSRKSLPAKPEDMPLVVPIHNAVNERAWAEIKSWELGTRRLREVNGRCGGPRLRSFRGESGRLTPRARAYGWLGYERPFDRHDWVVERCVRDGEGGGGGEEGREGDKGGIGGMGGMGAMGKGEEVEYVIDFYRGRGGMGNFYLDVRPKLNSWEGWRLRMGRFLGLG